MEKRLEVLLYILVVATVVVSLAGAGFVISKSVSHYGAARQAAEAAKPANLDIKIISAGNSCSNCFDMNAVVDAVKQQNVKINSENTVDAASEDGKKLISNYKITKLPALIITGEISRPSVSNLFSASWQTDGKSAVFTGTYLPYFDLAKNKIIGLVSVVYLSSSTCKDCYDVKVNKQILEGKFGMTLASETFVNNTDQAGSGYITKYKLEKLPAILVSPEARDYASFVAAWKSVGDVADDGWYVMRKPEALGKIDLIGHVI